MILSAFFPLQDHESANIDFVPLISGEERPAAQQQQQQQQQVQPAAGTPPMANDDDPNALTRCTTATN
jgi:hypothetical protein